MNNVTLVGRLTRDLELRYVSELGTPVANFTIAVDREYAKGGKKETDFIDIQVWGKSAENCSNYIEKGSLVGIQGSLRIDNYLKDDEKRKAIRVNANRVQFLDNRKPKNNSSNEPNFIPPGIDPNGWGAIDSDDIPF